MRSSNWEEEEEKEKASAEEGERDPAKLKLLTAISSYTSQWIQPSQLRIVYYYRLGGGFEFRFVGKYSMFSQVIYVDCLALASYASPPHHVQHKFQLVQEREK